MSSKSYEAEPDIHRAIQELVQQLTILEFATIPEESQRISQIIGRLNELNLDLLIVEVQGHDNEIKDATKLFNQAKKSAEHAVTDIQKMSDIIAKIAKAVGMLEKAITAIASVAIP